MKKEIKKRAKNTKNRYLTAGLIRRYRNRSSRQINKVCREFWRSFLSNFVGETSKDFVEDGTNLHIEYYAPSWPPHSSCLDHDYKSKPASEEWINDRCREFFQTLIKMKAPEMMKTFIANPVWKMRLYWSGPSNL